MLQINDSSPKNRAKWDKTGHQYLPTDVLEQYRRKLGNLLLKKEMVDASKLGSLISGMEKNKKLGQILLEMNVLSNEHLRQCLRRVST